MMKFTRITAAFMLVAVLLVSSVACAKTGNGETTTTEAPAIADTVTETPEDTAEKLSIPDSLDCGGETMGVLYWSDVENTEFFIESEGEVLDKTEEAIKRRNAALEDRMKVKLEFIPQEGRNSKLKDYVNYVSASLSTSDHAFDIMAAYSQTMANAAYNGFCYDLATTEYLDLEKPWWPALLTKEATVNGRLYFVSGDISTNLLYMMYTVFFNKELLGTRADLKSPYDMIAANEWTVDNMFAMSSDFYRDLDASQNKSDGDQFGFVLPELSIDALFYGSNLRTTDKNEDGTLVVSETYFSEKAQSLLEKLFKVFYDSDDGLWRGGTNIFTAGRALFYCDRAVTAVKKFGDVTFEYGVVPAPKWDSEQDAYYTCAGNPFTLYGVIANSERADLASAVLECWAYEAYNYTTPAIFEVTMKIRFAKDSDTAVMYDMIRDGVTFDLGRIYGITMNDLTQTLYRKAMDNRTAWSSRKVANSKMLSKYLEGVNDAYTR